MLKNAAKSKKYLEENEKMFEQEERKLDDWLKECLTKQQEA